MYQETNISSKYVFLYIHNKNIGIFFSFDQLKKFIYFWQNFHRNFTKVQISYVNLF
jgi:hypothetical protein